MHIDRHRQGGSAVANTKILPAEEVTRHLTALPGWSVAEGALHKEYAFKDFVHAFSFMAGVALVAERMNHHPDWSNAYNRVVVSLTTHSEGGITDRDMELAESMEHLFRGEARD
jgi:4a-hydroxytetrahydrobiopterin dehydratase